MTQHDAVFRDVTELVGLLVERESQPETLARLAEIARLTVPGCDACVVTVWDGTGAAVVATTDPALARGEAARFATGTATDATRTGTRVEAAPDGGGYTTVLALPLRAGGAPLGAMRLYARTAAAFDGAAVLAGRLATWAAVAIDNGRTFRAAGELADRLAAARPGADLGLATGIVLAEQRRGPDDALAWLHERAGLRGVDVGEVARGVVAARSAREA